MHLPMMVALKDIGEDVCSKVPFFKEHWLDAYLIGIWFGKDQRANIVKTHVKKRLVYISKY